MIVKHMQYANLFPPFFVWIPSFYDDVFVVQSVCFCEVFLHSYLVRVLCQHPEFPRIFSLLSLVMETQLLVV